MRIPIDLPKEMMLALDAVAQSEGRTRADLIREVLKRHLDKKRDHDRPDFAKLG